MEIQDTVINIYLYRRNPTAPLLRTLNNQVAWRVYYISNIPMSHSKIMTDYKVFNLDYVPDGKSWSKTFRSRKCFYMIRIRIHSCIVHLEDIVWFPGNMCSYCAVYNTSEAHSYPLKSITIKHCCFNFNPGCVETLVQKASIWNTIVSIWAGLLPY